MTNDEGMTKSEGSEAHGVRNSGTFWGAHGPSRASFGALAEITVSPVRGKVRDHEGVIASTRGACAPL